MRIVGIGVDVVDVDRMRRLLARRPGLRRRVFSPAEVEACAGRRDPAPCLAARWAAREAAVKALGGVPGLDWRDVTVEEDGGSPRLALAGSARERARQVGATDLLVSLTHERSVAAAFCVAVG